MQGAARHVADRRPPQVDGPRRGGVRRVATWVAGALAVVLAVVVGVSALAVWRLKGNITAVDVTGRLGDRPAAAGPGATDGAVADGAGAASSGTPLNLLVLGSDSREGANGFVGGTTKTGARSDTTLLLHLSADRARALAVSIPRDSMVDMPSCLDRENQEHPAGLRQFNDAYTIGGAACTQRTVEQLTGVRVDHYVVVDFAGFKGMVDALGTVPICLPHAVNDTRHHIQLPAGRSRVDGEQALAFVRERYVLGDGGDLGRIGRQHAFLSAVLQEATSAGTLTNPGKLYAFLSAATRSVTMDPELAGLPTLAGLARQVEQVGLGNIRFVTVPTEAYPADPNRLQWAPSAERLWQAVRTDAPVVFTAPGTGAPSATSSATAGLPGGIEPAQVRVRVLNATGTPGAAATAARDLRRAGFGVVAVGDAGTTGATVTRIRYGPGALAERRASALAAVLPGAELVPDDAAGATLRVEVGSDWAGVLEVPPGSPSAGPSDGPAATPSAGEPVVVPGVTSRSAGDDICAS